ncbi:MAG: class B sortase [Bacilli bacterium]|nr:class B sortase [Bacilli bacterium]
MKKIKNLLINVLTFPKYLIIGIKFFFNEKKQKELKMEEKIIPIIVSTLSIITYLVCIFLLTRWYVQNTRNQKFAEQLTNETQKISEQERGISGNKNKGKYNYKYPDDLSFLNVDLTPYLRINPETVAWIQVNGTIISYPVVQHKDNDYYLNHDFYRRKTEVGAIFADYRDNFDEFNDNNIIYGHNIVNGTMFGQLPRVLGKSWQSNPNYHYIKLSTKKTNTIWKIFSVYEVSPTIDYLQSNFNSNETYKKFISLIKNRSSYDFKTEVNTDDKIITLSTCNNIGNKRVVVHAKLINLENK